MSLGASFWNVIRVISTAEDEPFDAAAKQLAALGGAAIRQFERDLASALAALDSPAVAEAADDLASDGTDLPWSDDALANLRCAVVLRGEQAYEQILADPRHIAGTWDVADAEGLEGIVDAALDLLTDDDEEDIESVKQSLQGPGDLATNATSRMPSDYVHVGLGWWVIGAQDLVNQTVREGRRERVNVSVAVEERVLADPYIARALAAGTLPLVDVNLSYDNFPRDQAIFKNFAAETLRVRRHADSLAVLVIRDFARFGSYFDKFDEEIESVGAAIVAAVRERLEKTSRSRP